MCVFEVLFLPYSNYFEFKTLTKYNWSRYYGDNIRLMIILTLNNTLMSRFP